MKLKTISLVALLAGIHSASAFSIDFSNLGLALDGSVTASGEGTANGPLVIAVEGFGNVGFGLAEKDVSAALDDNFGVGALEFDSNRTITIGFFSGSQVENVVLGFVGPDGSDAVYTRIDGTSGTVTVPVGPGGIGQAGIATLNFDRIGPKVPEPSTALLGGLGMLALLRRRR